MAYNAAHRTNDAISLLKRTLADGEHAIPPDHPLLRSIQESLKAIGDA
jgi:hypothetical protein